MCYLAGEARAQGLLSFTGATGSSQVRRSQACLPTPVGISKAGQGKALDLLISLPWVLVKASLCAWAGVGVRMCVCLSLLVGVHLCVSEDS